MVIHSLPGDLVARHVLPRLDRWGDMAALGATCWQLRRVFVGARADDAFVASWLLSAKQKDSLVAAGTTGRAGVVRRVIRAQLDDLHGGGGGGCEDAAARLVMAVRLRNQARKAAEHAAHHGNCEVLREVISSLSLQDMDVACDDDVKVCCCVACRLPVGRYRDRDDDIYPTNTMFYSAATNGHADVVRLLLSWRGDCIRINNAALSCAASNGHEAIVRMLLDWPTNPATVCYESFGEAARKGHIGVVRVFLERLTTPAQTQNTVIEYPFCSAAAGGHEDVVFLLLRWRWLDRGDPPDDHVLGEMFRRAVANGKLELARKLLGMLPRPLAPLRIMADVVILGCGETLRLVLDAWPGALRTLTHRQLTHLATCAAEKGDVGIVRQLVQGFAALRHA